MRQRVPQLILIVAVLLGSLALTTAAAAMALKRPHLERLSTETRSELKADYSADPRGARFAPLDPDIARAAAADGEALTAAGGMPRRVGVAYRRQGTSASTSPPPTDPSPVATAAPASPELTGTPSVGAPTSTPVTPEATATPEPTPEPTEVPPPTVTLVPTETPLPTQTPVTPTPTPLPCPRPDPPYYGPASSSPSLASDLETAANRYRGAAGLLPLKRDERLVAAAEAHARFVSEHRAQLYAKEPHDLHWGANCSTYYDRAVAHGYPAYGVAVYENVVGGPAGITADEMFRYLLSVQHEDPANPILEDIGTGCFVRTSPEPAETTCVQLYGSTNIR